MSGEQVTLSMFEVTVGEWLYECDECGAVVRQGVTHTDWHQRGDASRKRWLEWLADVGYGLDFTHDPHPPCTPREVAEVYAEREPIDNLDLNAGETSTEVHEWVIAQNTGWEA